MRPSHPLKSPTTLTRCALGAQTAMGAELLPGPRVSALGEQVQVEVAEQPAVAVRVVDLEGVSAVEGDAEAIVGDLGPIQGVFEQAVGREAPHRAEFTGGRQAEIDARGIGTQRTDHDASVAGAMGAEEREDIAGSAADQCRQGRVDHHVGWSHTSR
jgi:hypothetical protein